MIFTEWLKKVFCLNKRYFRIQVYIYIKKKTLRKQPKCTVHLTDRTRISIREILQYKRRPMNRDIL